MNKLLLYVLLIVAVGALAGCHRGMKTDDDTAVADLVDTSEVGAFDEPQMYEGGQVFRSEDGLVEVESGICPWGGSSPMYWAKCTITDSKGQKHELRYDELPAISNLHSLHKKDGSTYYIVSCHYKCGCLGDEWLKAFRIVGDTIRQVRVKDGGEYEDKHEFSVTYSIPDWYDATHGAGYGWIFEYDNSTKELSVPITDKDHCIIDRYEVWHFNGDCFVSLGEKPHRKLHESLVKYNRLVQYFVTKEYIVRVDSLNSGELRYASWKRPKSMSDKPDVVIKGGKRYQHPVPPDELHPCDDFRFENDGYEYIVNYCEIEKLTDGHGHHHEYLLVKKNGKTLLKQPKI